jgi:DNA invertase Pin-like site-specific DNA recombinase
MGRLTLNVLLSFAQFERELASERIRDKFAASRRKGMWMGGTVPLGYDVKNRKLVLNADEAERVRLIFRRYVVLGCVSALQEDLEQRGVHSKRRILTSGRVLGGCSFGRGALYHLLQNRIYRGEVVHQGAAYAGEQERIIDEELWSAVQAKLEENWGTRRRSKIETGALLRGVIFDDRGNLMSPTYSIRRGNRYRYYVSRALIRGRKANAGSQSRVSADDIERLVVETLNEQFSRPKLLSELTSGNWSTGIRALVQENIERVVVGNDKVQIICKIPAIGEGAEQKIRTVPLPGKRARARQEIVMPGGRDRAPRHVNHALVLAIARAKTWMQDLRIGTYADTTEIARRFKLNDSHVRRLLRFGYLAPDLVEAIVEGRQPRSLTVKRLLQGIPCAWSEQRALFGFSC